MKREREAVNEREREKTRELCLNLVNVAVKFCVLLHDCVLGHA